MSANEVVGVCACPICKEPGAEIRKGAKGSVYIHCGECVGMVKTMSGKGQRAIKAMAAAEFVPQAEVKAAVKEKTDEEKAVEQEAHNRAVSAAMNKSQAKQNKPKSWLEGIV